LRNQQRYRNPHPPGAPWVQNRKADGVAVNGDCAFHGGRGHPQQDHIVDGDIGDYGAVAEPGGLGSVGKLTIGSLVTASNLTLDFELTTPGGSNDLLTITNSLTLNPNTAITFGTDPTAYGDYRLISYGSFAGSLSDFDLPGAPPNTMYTLSTTVDPGYIDLVVAVPEPSTLVLLGTAAIGLLGWAWRRRSR